MRNLLAFLAAAAITIALVGWYLDWFQVRSGTNAESGQPKVEIEVNGKKIGQDLHRSEQAIQKAIEKGREEAPNKADHTKGDSVKRTPEADRDETSKPVDGPKSD